MIEFQNSPEGPSILIGGDGKGGVCSLVVVARWSEEAFGTGDGAILRRDVIGEGCGVLY